MTGGTATMTKLSTRALRSRGGVDRGAYPARRQATGLGRGGWAAIAPVRSAMPSLHPTHGVDDLSADGRLTWRDWWPVLVATLLALVLAGGLLALFGSISSYQRDRALTGLAGSVVWLA